MVIKKSLKPNTFRALHSSQKKKLFSCSFSVVAHKILIFWCIKWLKILSLYVVQHGSRFSEIICSRLLAFWTSNCERTPLRPTYLNITCSSTYQASCLLSHNCLSELPSNYWDLNWCGTLFGNVSFCFSSRIYASFIRIGVGQVFNGGYQKLLLERRIPSLYKSSLWLEFSQDQVLSNTPNSNHKLQIPIYQ